MDNVSRINIELVYINPPQQVLLPLNVENNATIEEIISSSGIQDRFPEIDLRVNKVGINNEIRDLTDCPRGGERIEIYRPLQADPKEARRNRAISGKQKSRGK